MDLSQVIADTRCQSRVELNDALVGEYAEAMAAGESFPPLSAVKADDGIYLFDGFHRLYAMRRAGRTSARVELWDGTFRDAVLRAVAANANHGKRRSNADKRKSVETLLSDPEWSMWSNSEIARRCMVSDKTVASIRQTVTSDFRSEERTYTDRHGNVVTMNTANIGKQRISRKETERVAESMRKHTKEDEPVEVHSEVEAFRHSDFAHEVVDVATGEVVATVPAATPLGGSIQEKPRNLFERQTAESLDGADPATLHKVAVAQAQAEAPEAYAELVYAAITFVARAQHKLGVLPDTEKVRSILFADAELQDDLGVALDTISHVAGKLRSIRVQNGAPELRRVS